MVAVVAYVSHDDVFENAEVKQGDLLQHKVYMLLNGMMVIVNNID